MKIIKEDLFSYIQGRSHYVIAHVVNNKGAMGAGFVVPLVKAFPNVKVAYMANKPSLGQCQMVEIANDSYVANMCGQTLGGKRPLFYNKLVNAMDNLVKHLRMINEKASEKYEIVCPRFGSGLAGGDSRFIQELIHDCWTKEGFEVTICEL